VRFGSASGECGVLYAAPGLAGAFVETFMQELGRTSVSLKELRDRPVAPIRPKRPLRFINLCAPGGQMRLGLDGRICTGSYGRGATRTETSPRTDRNDHKMQLGPRQ
jgi:hypothetical protein